MLKERYLEPSLNRDVQGRNDIPKGCKATFEDTCRMTCVCVCVYIYIYIRKHTYHYMKRSMDDPLQSSCVGDVSPFGLSSCLRGRSKCPLRSPSPEASMGQHGCDDFPK